MTNSITQPKFTEAELDEIEARFKTGYRDVLTCEDIEEFVALKLARPRWRSPDPYCVAVDDHFIALVLEAQTAGVQLADLYPGAPSRREGRRADQGFSFDSVPPAPVDILGRPVRL